MTDDVGYDAGALIGVEAGDRAVLSRHQRALARKATPVVPAPVLAQAWRGGPQPLLSRFLAGYQVTPMDEEAARAAGTACGRAGTSDVIDATVVVTARRLGAVVLTGDHKDIERLVEAIGGGVAVDRV